MSHEQQVRALMAEAGRSPGLLARYDLLEEAVRVADAHRDIRLGFEARLALVKTGAWLARGDVATVAFTWCLHQYDSRPDLFGGCDLLNEYTLVLNAIANYDAISREQLEAMVADYGARRVRTGRSPGHRWAVTLLAAADLGDRTLAAQAAAELKRLRLESFFWPWQWFRHAVFMDDQDWAMRLAEAELLVPGGDSGFDRKWYELPLLLLQQGRADEAALWQSRAVAQLARVGASDNYRWGYGPLVASLALAGQLDEAVSRFAQCHRLLRSHVAPLTRLHFNTDMSVLFDRLHGLGTEAVWVRLGEEAPHRRADGRYSVAELREWLAAEARELAARFDRRNGNTYFAGRIRERAELQRLALPPKA